MSHSNFRQWREENPEKYQKRLARFRQWREQNREKHNRIAREGVARRRRADPEKYNQSMREYYANSPEQKRRRDVRAARYYQSHKARHAENGRRWAANHVEQERIRSKNKIAWRRKAVGKFTLDDIQALYEKQNGKCAICALVFSEAGRNKYQIDHIIPLRPRGASMPVGTNNPDNLQLLCRKCNRLKSNHLPPTAASQ